MKTPINRLDTAIKKLYIAFNNNTLHPECCKQCAVGNILDHSDAWKHFSDEHGSTTLNYVGRVNEAFGKRFNGYTPSELLFIEKTFLQACGYQLPLDFKNKKPENPTDKDVLFNGLQAVIELLCKLDNSPDVMDYTKLFENLKTKTCQPKLTHL
ncbi:Na(+)-translocating NADH-quinone reductase subunit F [Aestuariibaculum suncheonense]|uniref:Na(+)-translocating NADH-quinone reductase subunit F n=1 Tax=Aestuariibaculum suncheonense TaxID=1028745 RepID=A0A8J6QB76_9FLAO|nr:Na(+)-translocating NADH-quinone reductase subunit F [Aestuariibaculum suncheonense]MBD0836395.1 Na(+)-translocating NADH-quinone reductase subunit F [Aestuariibaculum suncheonense]